MSRPARLFAVLPGLVLVLVLATPATARAADFGYLGVLGCLDTPSDDPRTLSDVHSVAVPKGGSPVYVAAHSTTTSDGRDRVIAFDPGGRQLWSIDHTANGVFDDPKIGISSDGIYVANRDNGFASARITRFVAGRTGATEAASWEVNGSVLSLAGSKQGSIEFVAVLTRPPSGGIHFYDRDGKSIGAVGSAENDPNFSLGLPQGISPAGGRLIVADNASTDSFNVTTGRIASYGIGYQDGELKVTSVYHVDVPFVTGGVWGTNDGIWLMGGDSRGSFAHYSNTLQPIDVFNRSNSTPGRISQIPFQAITADGLGNVYLADLDRVVRLGPGGALPSPGTMVGQCNDPTPTGRLTLMTPAQNVFRQHGMVVDVACTPPCTSVASGAITIFGTRTRKLRFQADRETVAQTNTRLHPRLSSRQLRRLRTALVARVPATLKVTVTATDTAGVVTRRVIRTTFG